MTARKPGQGPDFNPAASILGSTRRQRECDLIT